MDKETLIAYIDASNLPYEVQYILSNVVLNFNGDLQELEEENLEELEEENLEELEEENLEE